MSFLLRWTQVGLWALMILWTGCTGPAEPGFWDADVPDAIYAGVPCDTYNYRECDCGASKTGSQHCEDGVMTPCECYWKHPTPDIQQETTPGGPCWPANCAQLGLLCDGYGQCVQCLQGSDCGSVNSCVNNQCVQSQCPAGKTFCVGQWPALCGPTGTSYAITGACAPGTGCHDGLCEPQTCGNDIVEGTEACDSPQEPTACTANCLQPTWDAPSGFGPYVQRIAHLSLLPAGQGCDLDEDGKPNNVMGKSVSLYAKVNKDLQAQVLTGQLGWAFAAKGGPPGGSPAPLALLEVSPALDQAACLAASPLQTCAYLVSPNSVDLASTATAVEARFVWPSAQLTGWKESDQFVSAQESPTKAYFVLPLMTWLARLPVLQLSMTAKLAPDGTLQEGMLCGVVTRKAMEEATHAMPEAALAEWGGKAQLLTLLGSLLMPDIDIDDDGKKDASSFAYTFDTAPATLLGLADGKSTKCAAGEASCLATCVDQKCALELAQCSTPTQCTALETCQFGRCTDCSSLTDSSVADQCLNACASAACEAESALCQNSSCQKFLQCVDGCAPGSEACISACASVVLDAGGQAALQRREACLAAAKRHCQ